MPKYRDEPIAGPPPTPYARLKEATDTAIGNLNDEVTAKTSAVLATAVRANNYQSIANAGIGTIIVAVNAVRRARDNQSAWLWRLVPAVVRTPIDALFTAVEEFDRMKGQLERDFGRELSDTAVVAAQLGRITGPVRIVVEGARGVGKTTVLNALKAVLPNELPVHLIEHEANPANARSLASFAKPVRDQRIERG
jgi:hypothetical protein